MRIYWLLAALVLSAILAGLQWWAVSDFLYWRYEWFDIPMHYLGGLAIATFMLALIPVRRPVLLLVLCVVFFVAWEVFEYVFGIPREANYALDTAQDLCLDFVGVATSYLAARFTLWRSA